MKITYNKFIKQFHCFERIIQKWREAEEFLDCLDEIKSVSSKSLNIWRLAFQKSYHKLKMFSTLLNIVLVNPN